MTSHIGFIFVCVLACTVKGAEKVVLLSGDTKEIKIEYVVPADRFLAETNAWSPTGTGLSSVVSEYSRRGIDYLRARRQFQGNLSLFRFDATSAMESFDARGNVGLGTRIRSWVLIFTFASDEPNPAANSATFRVVMLLDGTIAEERLIRGSIGLAMPPR